MSRSKAHQTARVLPILNARARTHLLANALSLIASLLRRRPDAAEDLLAHLGRLLHETVADAQPFVPLATEMASALSFLGLERARLGGRLRLEVVCSDDVLMIPVPSVIMQPLVENAIRHGVAMKPGGGLVRIRAAIRRGHMHLTVSDDGAGWRRGGYGVRASGWGIMGARLRLAALCGSRARLRVWSRPDLGTIAAVTVPISYAGAWQSRSRSRPPHFVAERCH